MENKNGERARKIWKLFFFSGGFIEKLEYT